MFKPLQKIKAALLSDRRFEESTVAPHSRFHHLRPFGHGRARREAASSFAETTVLNIDKVTRKDVYEVRPEIRLIVLSEYLLRLEEALPLQGS